MCPFDSKHCVEFSVLIHKYSNNGILRFDLIPTNNKRGVPFAVHKRRERKKLTKADIPLGLKLFSVFCVAGALIYKYVDNEIFGFEFISTNNECSVPFVVR
ncbi:hypothetical protein KAU32_07565, partial [bacterium]|nr:hypothetical protein [bacterium]